MFYWFVYSRGAFYFHFFVTAVYIVAGAGLLLTSEKFFSFLLLTVSALLLGFANLRYFIPLFTFFLPASLAEIFGIRGDYQQYLRDSYRSIGFSQEDLQRVTEPTLAAMKLLIKKANQNIFVYEYLRSSSFSLWQPIVLFTSMLFAFFPVFLLLLLLKKFSQ